MRREHLSTKLRVLHSSDAFVNLTENWIFPQVVEVPGTQSAVLCDERLNANAFPFPRRKLFVSRPPWHWNFGVSRFLGEIALRVYRPRAASEWRARNWRPNLIHAHFGTRGWQSIPLKKRLQVPLIVSFYGYDAWLLPQQNTLWRDRYVELFYEAEQFLVEGPAMKARLVDLGCPESKVRIHRLGVDVAALPFRPRKFKSPVRVIMIGSFVEKKGFPDGLKACLKARQLGIDLAVTIIGDAPPGRPAGLVIKRTLLELSKHPALSGRVKFCGYIPLHSTIGELKRHDVLLCPSKHSAEGDGEGGSPVVLTQAMALGLLPVATKHCDIPELVIDGETGLLCAEADIQGIARALRYLADSPEVFVPMTLRSRALIERNFDLQMQLREQVRIYTDVIAKRALTRKRDSRDHDGLAAIKRAV